MVVHKLNGDEIDDAKWAAVQIDSNSLATGHFEIDTVAILTLLPKSVAGMHLPESKYLYKYITCSKNDQFFRLFQ